MPPKLKFNEGERVLCFHGPLIYEAKCIKGQVKEKTPRYLIHYNGWNKNWDEWVPESRVLKYNEANLMKQKELREQMYVLSPLCMQYLNDLVDNCCSLIILLCHMPHGCRVNHSTCFRKTVWIRRYFLTLWYLYTSAECMAFISSRLWTIYVIFNSSRGY